MGYSPRQSQTARNARIYALQAFRSPLPAPNRCSQVRAILQAWGMLPAPHSWRHCWFSWWLSGTTLGVGTTPCQMFLSSSDKPSDVLLGTPHFPRALCSPASL